MCLCVCVCVCECVCARFSRVVFCLCVRVCALLSFLGLLFVYVYLSVFRVCVYVCPRVLVCVCVFVCAFALRRLFVCSCVHTCASITYFLRFVYLFRLRLYVASLFRLCLFVCLFVCLFASSFRCWINKLIKFT